MNALIGHTGFVGSNILEQKDFDFCYNSKNIEEIKGKEFDLVVCAATTAVKWKSNKNPREDYRAIIELIKCLDTIKFNKFVLKVYSTFDLFWFSISLVGDVGMLK